MWRKGDVDAWSALVCGSVSQTAWLALVTEARRANREGGAHSASRDRLDPGGQVGCPRPPQGWPKAQLLRVSGAVCPELQRTAERCGCRLGMSVGGSHGLPVQPSRLLPTDAVCPPPPSLRPSQFHAPPPSSGCWRLLSVHQNRAPTRGSVPVPKPQARKAGRAVPPSLASVLLCGLCSSCDAAGTCGQVISARPGPPLPAQLYPAQPRPTLPCSVAPHSYQPSTPQAAWPLTGCIGTADPRPGLRCPPS